MARKKSWVGTVLFLKEEVLTEAEAEKVKAEFEARNIPDPLPGEPNYDELGIDEPLPDTPRNRAIRAKAETATHEERLAGMDEAWFINPGGIFRMRILRHFEREGLVKFTSASIKIVNPDNHPHMPAELAEVIRHLVELMQAVGGVLDEPEDMNRTRADYAVLN
jgi:hypothetical protein